MNTGIDLAVVYITRTRALIELEAIARLFTTEELKFALRIITIAILGPDPHTGGSAHPDTVDAYVEGYIDALGLNNARPAKYTHEPWRGQGAQYHAEHAVGHAQLTLKAVELFKSGEFPTIEQVKGWISDLGKPELLHAIVRLFFLLWSLKRGVK